MYWSRSWNLRDRYLEPEQAKPTRPARLDTPRVYFLFYFFFMKWFLQGLVVEEWTPYSDKSGNWPWKATIHWSQPATSQKIYNTRKTVTCDHSQWLARKTAANWHLWAEGCQENQSQCHLLFTGGNTDFLPKGKSDRENTPYIYPELGLMR